MLTLKFGSTGIIVSDVRTLTGEKSGEKSSCPSEATILAREINQAVIHQSMMRYGDKAGKRQQSAGRWGCVPLSVRDHPNRVCVGMARDGHLEVFFPCQ